MMRLKAYLCYIIALARMECFVTSSLWTKADGFATALKKKIQCFLEDKILLWFLSLLYSSFDF